MTGGALHAGRSPGCRSCRVAAIWRSMARAAGGVWVGVPGSPAWQLCMPALCGAGRLALTVWILNVYSLGRKRPSSWYTVAACKACQPGTACRLLPLLLQQARRGAGFTRRRRPHLAQELLPKDRPGVRVHHLRLRLEHLAAALPHKRHLLHARRQLACGVCARARGDIPGPAPIYAFRPWAGHVMMPQYFASQPQQRLPAKNGMTSNSNFRGVRPRAFCALSTSLRPTVNLGEPGMVSVRRGVREPLRILEFQANQARLLDCS